MKTKIGNEEKPYFVLDFVYRIVAFLELVIGIYEFSLVELVCKHEL